MPFSEVQNKALSAKLSPKQIRTRESNGRTLSYVEGWHAIAEANRIFGFECWDRETLRAECVWKGTRLGQSACSYIARVRVRVRAGDEIVVREGYGSGHGSGATPGEAHESAIKEAETDAMKRALMTFGNPFGLALYDKKKRGVRQAPTKKKETEQSAWVWTVLSSDGAPVSRTTDASEFCVSLEAQLQNCTSVSQLKGVWRQNRSTVVELRKRSPDLKGPDLKRPELKADDGRSRSEVLIDAYKARLEHLTSGSDEQTDLPLESSVEAASSEPVDRSELPIGVPKRMRDKEHLKFIAARACLVCGRKPSHPHHVRFAQPRALGRKVGDQWAVPLCAIHHRDLHNFGDEKAWWARSRLDPIEEGMRLWRISRGPPDSDDLGQQGTATT